MLPTTEYALCLAACTMHVMIARCGLESGVNARVKAAMKALRTDGR